MDNYNLGNLIFWLICLGLLVGGVGRLFFGKRCRGTASNVLGAAAISVIVGMIARVVGLKGVIAFGVMGAAAFLILFNVFCLVDPANSVGPREEINKV